VHCDPRLPAIPLNVNAPVQRASYPAREGAGPAAGVSAWEAVVMRPGRSERR